MKRSIFFVLVALCLLIATPLFAGNKSNGQVLYQPALYNNFTPTGGPTTIGYTRLIFRNLTDQTITLIRVDFYGPLGTDRTPYQYLEEPVPIGPFHSVTFFYNTGSVRLCTNFR